MPAGVLSFGFGCRSGCARGTGEPKIEFDARFVPPEPGPRRAAPRVLYTDALAGPNAGGENDKGMYLSIFGVGFGATGLGSRVKVFVGDAEVDNYRYLGASRGRPDIQQITVQVGSLGNPKPGEPLPIKVVADGVASNVDHTFTVQPGDFYFVSTRGNDATAAKNDGGAEAMFKAMDKNNDGAVSKEEAQGTPHAKDFDKLDKNHDGKLSRDEHAAAPEHQAKAGKDKSAGTGSSTQGTDKKKY